MDNVYLIAATWMGLALAASLVSIRLGISVALIEIGVGIIGGNFLGLLHASCGALDALATGGAADD